MGRSLEKALIPIAALAVSLVLFGAFVALAGADPLEVYYEMYRGGFGTWFSFQNTLQRAAPLMLTALCCLIPAHLGLVVCGLTYLLVMHSVHGFAARMIGGNVRAATLSGIGVARLTIALSFLAGACAGIAGAIEVGAVHHTANATLIAGYGYTGVLVAFLARQHPLAAIPVSLLLGGINASGGLLQRTAHLPDATVKVLQGILFVVILASETFYGRWN